MIVESGPREIFRVTRHSEIGNQGPQSMQEPQLHGQPEELQGKVWDVVTIEVKVDIITAQVSALTISVRICFQPLFQLLALNFTSIIRITVQG